MRLIDADTLLTQIKYKPVPNIIDETWNELYERVIEEIDNAPTITPTLQLEDITDEDVAKFVMIWQRATSKGLILDPTRSQGKCEECDFRKFTETIVDGVVDVMNKNGITDFDELAKQCGVSYLHQDSITRSDTQI